MVNSKGKLKMALAAERGTNWKNITDKRKAKAAARAKKRSNPSTTELKSTKHIEDEEEDDGDDWEGVDSDEESDANNGVSIAQRGSDDEAEDEEAGGVDIEDIDESESDSEVEMEERLPQKPKSKPSHKAAGAEDEDEEDEDIPLSDLEDMPEDDREDLIPHQRSTINNKPALLKILNRIKIPTDDSVAFVSHLTITSDAPTADSIDDINDDIKRELAFYAQGKSAALEARKRLRKEDIPFTRPGDYFAEMVKDDGHMEKVKAKLVEEATNKKAAAEARKLRDLKKFGKQVQVAKLQERAKQKRETLDKIKALKKKRSDTRGAGLGTTEADLFDVGVDNELSKPTPGASKKRGPPGSAGHQPNPKRQKKNEKYGFGGKKRHAKSNDAFSSGDLSGFNGRSKKKGAPAGGASKRPGKARRKAIAGRR